METLKLSELDKIRFDLNEEKNNLRLQEANFNKLNRKLKLKEAELEQERKTITMKKDCTLLNIFLIIRSDCTRKITTRRKEEI